MEATPSSDASSGPTWVEIRVHVPIGWHELVADALLVTPCTTVSIGQTSIGQAPPPPGCEVVRTFVAEPDDGPRLRASLRKALAELAARAGVPELSGLELLFRHLPREDYATSWRKSWRPFRIGRLVVRPPWDVRPLDAGEVLLRLEPGGSFGSGRHATTRACLVALQERTRGGEKVLDAGSGSGILGVAAALLGAGSSLGFDIDSNAMHAGRALARGNEVHDRCHFRKGGFEVLERGDVDFDIVLANIYSDVIRAHAQDLHGRLARGGTFVFSGCPVHHREWTLEAIRLAGLEVESERRRGRWHTFVGRRP